jgi:uncharacterized protein YukE
MSDKVFVDPRRLREFAADLKTFRSNVTELTGYLEGSLRQLSDSWHDEQFMRFQDAFRIAQQRLRHFAEEIEQTAPQLEKDAQAAEEIHNLQMPN